MPSRNSGQHDISTRIIPVQKAFSLFTRRSKHQTVHGSRLSNCTASRSAALLPRCTPYSLQPAIHPHRAGTRRDSQCPNLPVRSAHWRHDAWDPFGYESRVTEHCQRFTGIPTAVYLQSAGRDPPRTLVIAANIAPHRPTRENTEVHCPTGDLTITYHDAQNLLREAECRQPLTPPHASVGRTANRAPHLEDLSRAENPLAQLLRARDDPNADHRDPSDYSIYR
jgi:hypothetical protein